MDHARSLSIAGMAALALTGSPFAVLATPVQIGPYQGYVSSYPAKRLVILTIGQAPDRHISIVARGPTESQVIARDALSKPDASN